jgi:hypothetical protein
VCGGRSVANRECQRSQPFLSLAVLWSGRKPYKMVDIVGAKTRKIDDAFPRGRGLPLEGLDEVYFESSARVSGSISCKSACRVHGVLLENPRRRSVLSCSNSPWFRPTHLVHFYLCLLRCRPPIHVALHVDIQPSASPHKPPPAHCLPENERSY